MEKMGIEIRGGLYHINHSQKTLDSILYAIVDWMAKPEHSDACNGGDMLENTSIVGSAPALLADIINNILQPKLICAAND